MACVFVSVRYGTPNYIMKQNSSAWHKGDLVKVLIGFKMLVVPLHSSSWNRLQNSAQGDSFYGCRHVSVVNVGVTRVRRVEVMYKNLVMMLGEGVGRRWEVSFGGRVRAWGSGGRLEMITLVKLRTRIMNEWWWITVDIRKRWSWNERDLEEWETGSG